jgi:hypothetical protein
VPDLIQGDSWLVGITADDEYLGLMIKSVNISIGPIFDGGGVMSVF